ncbi:MAG: hypothetical protein K5866_00550 [Treponema sp.]|nr:hypothetical protein [Treponema sp.]
MKETKKFTLVFAIITLIGSSLVFARSNPKINKDNQKDSAKKMEMNGEDGNLPKIDYIGKVTAIDTENSSVTIADADGNEFTVIISPFTHIKKADMEKAPENPPKDMKDAPADLSLPKGLKNPPKMDGDLPENEESLDISAIKTGDWLMISIYKTDTKNLLASRIILKSL